MTSAMDLPGAGERFTVEEYADRGAWLEARRTGIGGSDAPALWHREIADFDQQTFGSPYSTWASKRGLPTGTDDTEAMEIGALVEPVIATMYERRTGDRLSYPGPFTILRSIEWPHLLVSLDRVIHRLGAPPGALECKNRHVGATKDWKDGTPLAVACQVQHALLVTGWQWGVAAAIIGGNKYQAHELTRDCRLLDGHLAACSELWEHVQSGQAPPADGHSATTRALKAIYAAESGEEVQLSDELRAIADELAEIKERAKALDEEAEERTNKLRAAIGNAPAGRFTDGSGFSYKTQNRAGYTVAPTSFRVLRAVKAPKGK